MYVVKEIRENSSFQRFFLRKTGTRSSKEAKPFTSSRCEKKFTYLKLPVGRTHAEDDVLENILPARCPRG